MPAESSRLYVPIMHARPRTNENLAGCNEIRTAIVLGAIDAKDGWTLDRCIFLARGCLEKCERKGGGKVVSKHTEPKWALKVHRSKVVSKHTQSKWALRCPHNRTDMFPCTQYLSNLVQMQFSLCHGEGCHAQTRKSVCGPVFLSLNLSQ